MDCSYSRPRARTANLPTLNGKCAPGCGCKLLFSVAFKAVVIQVGRSAALTICMTAVPGLIIVRPITTRDMNVLR